MSAAVAPRPWTRTSAAAAVSSDAPAARIGWPAWSLAIITRLRSRPLDYRRRDRRQVELQVFAPALVLGWELKGGAERLGGLVHRETRPLGRDLEETPPGLRKVARVKVLAVDHGLPAPPRLHQKVAPAELVLVVERAP